MNNLIGEQMETLYNLAAGKKVEVKEKEILCEKCGQPTINKLVGDEWFSFCEDCQWTSGEKVNDNFLP